MLLAGQDLVKYNGKNRSVFNPYAACRGQAYAIASQEALPMRDGPDCIARYGPPHEALHCQHTSQALL